VRLHGLLGLGTQLVPIKLGRPRVVLDLGVGGAAVVGAEELRGVRVAAQLHLAELEPGPVGVQVGAAHEGQMHAQVAVHGRTVDANEDAIGNGGPGGSLGSAVEAGLRMRKGEQGAPLVRTPRANWRK